MSDKKARRHRRKRASRKTNRLPDRSLSQQFRLPPTPFQRLPEAEIERLHDASLAILARTGVVFRSQEALAHFRGAGARVVGDRVRLDRDLLETCLGTAPAQYTLHARNPAHSVTIGGEWCAVMPGGGPPYVRDLDGRRRPGTLADLADFARLSQLSPQVHVMARKAVEAQDLPAVTRHLDCWQTMLTLTDKPIQSGFVFGGREAEDALEMLAIVFGGEAALDGRPVAHCSVNANSPLLFDTPMLESLLLFARWGQPVLISPFVMAGVSGPATLAGALAQHNAEALAGIALTQLVRPGTPVLYGTATSNLDMRGGAPAIGSPESAVSIAVCAQLARRYGLPCRGGGALTDAPIPDAQSHYERTFTLLTSVLSGVHYLMHGLGVLESYLTLSYEQFVIDLELLDMVRHFVEPLDISAETLALEIIDQVGPGGAFLDTAHTLRHHRTAGYLPHLSLRQTYESWQASGGGDTLARANERCRELLAAYVQPEMASDITGRLADFVERRREAYGRENGS